MHTITATAQPTPPTHRRQTQAATPTPVPRRALLAIGAGVAVLGGRVPGASAVG